MATRAGLARVRASTFRRCIGGDADLCAFAGFGYETAGDLDPAQTLTTTFRMANVDMARRRDDHQGPRSTPLMAEAAESGDYDLPATRGQRPHHAGRRHDRHGDDPPGFLASRRRGSHRQRHRPVVPDRGRDGRPAPGARVRPVPASTGCPATSGRRSSRSGPRSASARRGGCTATTGSPATTSWPRAASTTRSACAARRSRTTTAARTRPGSTCPTARRSASRIGRWWSATRPTSSSPGAASRATHDAHASVR